MVDLSPTMMMHDLVSSTITHEGWHKGLCLMKVGTLIDILSHSLHGCCAMVRLYSSMDEERQNYYLPLYSMITTWHIALGFVVFDDSMEVLGFFMMIKPTS